MIAGREMDELVAEKVMNSEFDVPHYSTSIEAAWAVVEKMNDRFAVSFSCCSQAVEWHCELSCSENVHFSAKGGTAPLAICLAALDAVGVEVRL